MATMRPSTFPNAREEHAIDREHDAFSLLQANLPESAEVVYAPCIYDKRNIQREPDFVLFWQQVGALILEVKNWNFDRVRPVDQRTVKLVKPNGTKSVSNPMYSAKQYDLALRHHLLRCDRERDLGLTVAEGRYQGSLKFHVGHAVVFMGTTEAELPTISKCLGNVPIAYLISEEALSDTKLLRERLKAVPKQFDNGAAGAELRIAADQVSPRTEDQEPIALPVVQSQLLGSIEGEGLELYNELREQLSLATSEVRALIEHARPDSPEVRRLETVIDQLADDRFEVGVFGTTAAGKSTLLNALLGERFLREGMGETSRTLTRICAPDDTYDHGTVLIRYKSLEQLRLEVEEHVKTIGLLPVDDDPIELNTDLADPAWRAQIGALVKESGYADDGATEASKRFLRFMLAGWQDQKDNLNTEVTFGREQADQLCHQEESACYIDERVIFHANGLTKIGVVLFDSPGVGSTFARHTDEAVRLAQKVDAAVLVTRVDYSFMEPDKAFLRNAVDVQRTAERKNLVVVLNQIGKIDPHNYYPPRKASQLDECIAIEEDKLRGKMVEFGLEDTAIYPTDAACHLHAGLVANDRENTELVNAYRRHYAMTDLDADIPMPRANQAASKVPALEAGLRQHLTENKYHIVLGRKLDSLETCAASYKRSVQKELEGINLDLERLLNAAAEHEKNRDKAQRDLTEYLEYALPGQLKSESYDLDEVINDVVEQTLEVISTESKRLNKKPSITLDGYQRGVMKASQAKAMELIRTARNRYEDRYKQLRQKALEERIPDILDKYGFPFTDTGIGNEAWPGSIKGLDGLRLTFWQNFKHQIYRIVTLFKSTLNIGSDLRARFRDLIEPQFRRDITDWVERDIERFRTLVQGEVSDLLESIDLEIQAGIEKATMKESERVEAARRLEHFSTQCDNAFERVKRLRVQVERFRPM